GRQIARSRLPDPTKPPPAGRLVARGNPERPRFPDLDTPSHFRIGALDTVENDTAEPGRPAGHCNSDSAAWLASSGTPNPPRNGNQPSAMIVAEPPRVATW